MENAVENRREDVTITHALAQSVRHPRSTTLGLAHRAINSVQTLRERRDAASYRATFGAQSYSAEDIADMWADPACPVNKRPGLA